MASIQLFSQVQSSIVFSNNGAFSSAPASTDGNVVDYKSSPGRLKFPAGAGSLIVTQDPIVLYSAFFKGGGSAVLMMLAADGDTANPITLATVAAGGFVNLNGLCIPPNTSLYVTGGSGTAVFELVGKMANSQTSV